MTPQQTIAHYRIAAKLGEGGNLHVTFLLNFFDEVRRKLP